MTPGAPPPPWRCDVRALLWLQRPPAAPPPGLPDHPWSGLALAGLVAYLHTPVGPYRELFAAPALLRGRRPVGHVPFMAVDSPPSAGAGRRHWSLPKVVAAFAPAADGGLAVRGDGWGATVRASVRRPRLPVTATGTCAQAWPDGSIREFPARLTGRAGPARVTVGTLAGAPAPAWVALGRRPALLIAGTLEISAPRAPRAAPRRSR